LRAVPRSDASCGGIVLADVARGGVHAAYLLKEKNLP
jgi:hypothetical protein